MVCIDELLGVSPVGAEARVRLGPDHFLVHAGVLSAAGYVELAAQTAGAMKGYLELRGGLPAREGFLAAAQAFAFHGLARVGDVLRVSVTRTAEVGGVSLIDAVIRLEADTGGGPPLAAGKLKLFMADPPPAGSL